MTYHDWQEEIKDLREQKDMIYKGEETFPLRDGSEERGHTIKNRNGNICRKKSKVQKSLPWTASIFH